jgi:two-component sensor histidine kinase
VDAIRESRERMQAIAILHQKLYRTDTSTRINMRSYVSELVDNIRTSVADTERMEIQVDVAPDIELDISQSVPLGLILNEGITNSIKYAYGENEKGSIRISLQHIGDRQLQLKIADHGKGLPEGLDAEQPHSLGLQLIRLFAEQLEGVLYFINNKGLEINLSFRTAEYIEAFIDKEKDITV